MQTEAYTPTDKGDGRTRDVVPNAALEAAEVDADAFESFFNRICPTHALTPTEVFAAIHPNTVRELRVLQPRNLVRVIVKLVGIMDEALHEPDTKALQRAMNAVRILTRLLPIVFEDPDYEDEFVERMFWRDEVPVYVQPRPRGQPAARTAAENATAAGTGVPESKPAAEGAVAPAPAPGGEPEGVPIVEWEPRSGALPDYPLGRAFVHISVSLLFVPGFTVAKQQFDLFVERVTQSRERGAQAEADIAQRVLAAVAAKKAAQASARDAAAAPIDEAEEMAAARREALLTLPPDTFATEANAVWPMLLWRTGVAFHDLPLALPTTNEIQNRFSILRLVTALCSQSLYESSNANGEIRSKFMDELTTGHCPFVPTLFYCLLNTVISYDPVGWGVPYASSITNNYEEQLVEACLQTLMLVLDYVVMTSRPTPVPAAPVQSAVVADSAGSPAPGERVTYAQFNIFRSLMVGITDALDFELLFNGITRLLKDVVSADSTVLPYSHAAFPAHQEALVLLWRLLEENPAFVKHVLERCDTPAAIAPILYLMWMGRKDPTKVSQVHLCTFLLLLMSGERAFGVGLNKPFTMRLPPPDLPPFAGSYADLAIIVLHKLVVDGLPELAPLYSCFLTIISNLSPYAKSLSVIASVKLVNLFELFASPRFLLARPGNHLFAAQLLETCNNVIQYQYESNAVFMYAILQRKDAFRRLAELTVSGYQEQLKQRATQAAQEDGSEDATVEAEPAVQPPGDGAAEQAAPPAEHADDENVDDSEWVRRNAATKAAQVQAQSVGATAAARNGATTGGNTSSAVAAPPASQHTRAASGSSAGSWEPTDEWLAEIKQKLPLDTPIALIDYLGPLVDEFLESTGGAVDDDGVVEYIRGTTAVGALPRPHAILMRRYEPNSFTRLWFKIFVYSLFYLRVSLTTPMFDSQAIKLFHIAVVTDSGEKIQ